MIYLAFHFLQHFFEVFAASVHDFRCSCAGAYTAVIRCMFCHPDIVDHFFLSFCLTSYVHAAAAACSNSFSRYLLFS